MPKISGVEFEEAWRRRVDVQLDDDLTVPFISRQDLLIAKVSAGRAQDLIDVDALRETMEHQDVEQQRHLAPPVTSARDELDQINEERARGMVKAA